MMPTISAMVLISLMLASCARAPSGAPGAQPRSSPTPIPTWAGPGPLREDGSVDVTVFNTYVDEVDAGWTRSPLRMALEFLALGDPSDPDSGALITMAEERASPEGGTEATVIVTMQGLHDDSVQGIRYTLEFQKQESGWILMSAVWGQRCAQRRGHQDYTVEPCI
jgi:hypothetical protein